MRSVWEGGVSFFEELRAREERAREREERWSEGGICVSERGAWEERSDGGRFV